MEILEEKARAAGRALILEALTRGRRVRLGFGGTSMQPLLCEGDVIEVWAPPRPPRTGDVVLYLSGDALVAHRVLAPSADGTALLVKGDFTSGNPERLDRDRVLGIVAARLRGGARLDLSTPFMTAAGRLLARLSPVAVPLGLSLPRPLRRGLRRVALRLLGAPRTATHGGTP